MRKTLGWEYEHLLRDLEEVESECHYYFHPGQIVQGFTRLAYLDALRRAWSHSNQANEAWARVPTHRINAEDYTVSPDYLARC